MNVILKPFGAIGETISYTRDMGYNRTRIYTMSVTTAMSKHFVYGQTPDDIVKDFIKRTEGATGVKVVDYRGVGPFRKLLILALGLPGYLIAKYRRVYLGETNMCDQIHVTNLDMVDRDKAVKESYESAKPVVERVSKRMKEEISQWEKVESRTRDVNDGDKWGAATQGVHVDVTLRNKKTGDIMIVDDIFRISHED